MLIRKTSVSSEPEGNRKLDIFFYITEFLFGIMFQEVDLLFRILPGGENHSTVTVIRRYVLPLVVLFCLYMTDSYVGKLTATYAACSTGAILQLCIIIAQAAQLRYDTEAVRISMGFVGDVLRPVRWALMYTTKPLKPFKVIRRFLVLTESSYLLGKAVMNAVKMIILPRYDRRYRLDMIIPTAIMIKLILYPLFVHLIYKKIMHCPMYFKMFSVENAAKDAKYVALQKMFRKRNRFQEPDPRRNQALGVGILVVLAVLIPFTVARFDYEVIKQFSRLNRDFLIEKNLSGAIKTIVPTVTIITLLALEFGVLRLAKNTRWRPYYITWMTYCFIIIIIALVMMIYIYMMLESEMPFPQVPPGKAHMTIFNCLPASIEIEWPHEGQFEKVRNQDYIRKILIPLKDGKTEQTSVVIYNKPTGKYQRVDITLEEGRENVYVASYDGLTRANMTEKLAFNRFRNNEAQVRVLDCLEECCHGSISFTPISKLHSNLNQTSKSIGLSKNLLSAKYGFAEGQYSLAYHPDETTTLKMGVISLIRLDKTILLIYSILHPAYKVWDMVVLNENNSAVYLPTVVLIGIFRIALVFEKLAILVNTIPEIYSSMFGIHVVQTSLSFFAASGFFKQDLNQNSFFLLLGLSMFGFVLYLAVVLKLRKYYRVDTPPDEQERRTRTRGSSKTSVTTTSTTGTTEPGGFGKVKNQ